MRRTGMTRSDESEDSAAVRAATTLPRPSPPDGDGDLSPREQVVFFVCVDVFLGGFVVFMGYKVSATIPFGWLYLLAGLPAWLLVRVLFFCLKGSETGLVTVDRDGVVRLVMGRRSVRRLARMYERGAGRWMRGAVLGGLGFFVAGMTGLVVATVLLDSPAPFLVFLTGSLWATLDLVRFSYVALVKARRDGQQALDGPELLPMLAAYGRRCGWRETMAGVPADRLLAVLREHPDDLRQIKEYATLHRLLSGAAMSMSRWGSTSGLS